MDSPTGEGVPAKSVRWITASCLYATTPMALIATGLNALRSVSWLTVIAGVSPFPLLISLPVPRSTR